MHGLERVADGVGRVPVDRLGRVTAVGEHVGDGERVGRDGPAGTAAVDQRRGDGHVDRDREVEQRLHRVVDPGVAVAVVVRDEDPQRVGMRGGVARRRDVVHRAADAETRVRVVEHVDLVLERSQDPGPQTPDTATLVVPHVVGPDETCRCRRARGNVPLDGRDLRARGGAVVEQRVGVLGIERSRRSAEPERRTGTRRVGLSRRAGCSRRARGVVSVGPEHGEIEVHGDVLAVGDAECRARRGRAPERLIDRSRRGGVAIGTPQEPAPAGHEQHHDGTSNKT